jgi:hypothetical protein
MNTATPTTAPDPLEQPLVQILIEELTAVPVADPRQPARTLEVPAQCRLRAWTELYWHALERTEFLEWASAFNIDFDTLRLKGQTLHAQTLIAEVPVSKTFSLEDDSGWWQMAPMLLSIAQRIDPAEQGLPYIGGKSANPLYLFPRPVILAFYGYPEPHNALQAQVMVDELKTRGFAAIDENGHTTARVVSERTAQLQDLQTIALKIEQTLQLNEQRSKAFDQNALANKSVQLTSTSVLALSADQVLKLGQILSRYGFAIPASTSSAKALLQRLREHTWSPLPYVSEYVQTRDIIQRYRTAFGEIDDCRYAIRRLESLSKNKAPAAKLSLDEYSEPNPASLLGERVDAGTKALLKLRSNPTFQGILREGKLPSDSRLLLTETGHVGTAGKNGWVNLTPQLEKYSALKALRDALKPMAAQAGGALRTNGQVSLAQMLDFYDIPEPADARDARLITQWERVFLLIRPSHMDHWYLLGRPGQNTQRFSAEQRKAIIETTAAFLPEDSPPLIDYLSEGIDTDLPTATLKARADYLVSRILITPRAHALGNELLRQLAPPDYTHGLLANNRERLLLAAMLLSLDPRAGEQYEWVIGQPLNDRFFWGETYTDVRRFIDGQYDLNLVKNKTLACHLLLSGVAPEFLIRDIPDAVTYMSSYHWVRLKQVVLYIESFMPGATRLMTYAQLMKLSQTPFTSSLRVFLAQHASASVVLDWAVARGVIQRNPEREITSYDPATLKDADSAFKEHAQLMKGLFHHAYKDTLVTPYTLAVTDLRKVLGDNPHLEAKVLLAESNASSASDTSTPAAAGSAPRYSLAELHLAGKLSTDLAGWRSTVTSLNLAQIAPSLSRLGNVTQLFHAALTTRLTRMKKARIALIKEAFCRLPISQREDVEDYALELFTLQPLVSGTDSVEATTAVGPFVIIALLRGLTPRVFEVSTRYPSVLLRRDVDIALLTPTAAGAVARSLPFDAEAYRRGTPINLKATCDAAITRLDIAGAPLAPQPRALVPDTFASTKVNAIATSAVDHLFNHYEAAVLQQAMVTTELEEAETCHATWLTFYRFLGPISS